MKATIAIVAFASAIGVASQTDPRREAGTAIKEAIRLLEKKDYVTMLKTFARPSELEEQLVKRTIEEAAAEFGEKRATDLLAALRAASTMTQTFSNDGARVDYTFEKPFGRERRITMVKIDGLWYLR